MKRILVVEDDLVLSTGLCFELDAAGYATQAAYNCKKAEYLVEQEKFSLAILDVNLPDGNGLDLLREIREKYDVSVIMLTANDMEIDIVTGLELGADDYITKPFSLAVLRARVATQLRRVQAQAEAMQRNRQAQAVVIDDYRFDFERMEYYHGDTQIELSRTEQKLLRVLVDNRGYG